MADSPLLRRSEVAERLNISPDTVKRLARRGELTERHVGPRLVRYLPEEVAAIEGRDRDRQAA